MTEPNKPVLALDGGGIRGIFTAAFLAHIENHLGCRIIDHVGLVTGTSTGSIIGLALASGYSAQEILEAYKEAAPHIFPKKRWQFARKLWSPKHDNKNLSEWLQQFFGEKTLGEAIVPVAIPSFDAEVGQPRVWKTQHNENLHFGHTKKMWEVALSSAAAPTYFPAVQVDGNGAYIDGGLWANNPSMVGIIEAYKFFDQPFDTIRLFSIGTGRRKTWLPFEKIQGKGLLGWATTIVELVLFSSSEAIEKQAKLLLPDEHYLRINEDLPNKMDLDDLSAMGQLENLGTTMGMTHLSKVKEFLQVPAERKDKEKIHKHKRRSKGKRK